MYVNFKKSIEKAAIIQDIQLGIDEIPFNIFLKNSGDVLSLCFWEYEDEITLIVSETNQFGLEELRIIPKENIEYINIFYDFDFLKEENHDNMVV